MGFRSCKYTTMISCILGSVREDEIKHSERQQRHVDILGKLGTSAITNRANVDDAAPTHSRVLWVYIDVGLTACACSRRF